jgi:hypothetical protein
MLGLEDAHMAGIVLTFPIIKGKVEAWRRFCQEMSGSRRVMYEASRVLLGITLERLALVENAFGSAAVTTLEAHDMGRALSQIISSDLPFDRWYRTQMLEMHGVNLDGYKAFLHPAPPPESQELLFEWTLPGSIPASSVPQFTGTIEPSLGDAGSGGGGESTTNGDHGTPGGGQPGEGSTPAAPTSKPKP